LNNKSRYAEAGVDIDKANRLVSSIKPLVASTHRKGVLTDLGGFAGLFALDSDKYERPVLVSSTDGVGTKLMLAFMTSIHDTVGIDLVAMSVNDIIVCGAEPLMFLDYFACGKLDSGIAEAVVKGVATGCRHAGCALIGGETAEMPGMYPDNEYDLAGFVVGVVERDNIVDGSDIAVGDLLVALGSSGLHSNGYSLVRKIFFEELGLSPHDTVRELGDGGVGEVLLTPTRIYVKTVLNLLKQFRIKGMVHVTGGGFQDNIPRILPDSCKVLIERDAWEFPPVFRFIQENGNVPEDEMLRTFNCGVGMVLVVPASDAREVLLQANAMGENAFILGRVVERDDADSPQCAFC
jgi:phosphoribosylformylglycinamidine cyclo-ligase